MKFKEITDKLPKFSKKKQRRELTRRRKIAKRTWRFFIGFILAVAVFSYFTNPFVKFSLVNLETTTVDIADGQLLLEQTQTPVLRDKVFFSQLAYLKSGWHIFSSKFSGGKKASRASVDQIIDEIHRLRFDPELPFIISGDHFSVFYNRSLGIFYHSLLDERTAHDSTNWLNRQLVYAKSLMYALEVYSQSDRLSTTIVPVGPHSVALLNIYAYPSDTLYSLLYGLDVLISSDAHQLYRYEVSTNYDLQTVDLGTQLLNQYKNALSRHYQNYINTIVNPQTKMVRKDIWVSGTKDLVKRQSSFYDNVILWRTHQLAQKLGIAEIDQPFLDTLREHILNQYWLDEEGYFLDNVSQQGIADKAYSSDWLIAYQTGFLNPQVEEDRVYLSRAIEYITRNALDRPFGVAYQAERRPYEAHLIPRIFAPDYGSTAIWSNWGMEYTKLNIAMAQVSGDLSYLTEAEHQISAYSYNIRRYRGYPEVYNYEGDFYRQTFYKSIRQTGWVVSFEQAREMLNWTKINWNELIQENQ